MQGGGDLLASGGCSVSIGGLDYSYGPGLAVGVEACGAYLSAYLNHIVGYAVLAQYGCGLVAAEALGYGAEVEHYPRILFFYSSTFCFLYLAVSHEGHDAVDAGLGGVVAVFEPKSPEIDERCHCYVECSAGGVGYLHGEVEDLAEHLVGGGCLVAVDAADCALRIEGGEGGVNLAEAVEDLPVIVGGGLIGDMVVGAEYLALHTSVGRSVGID